MCLLDDPEIEPGYWSDSAGETVEDHQPPSDPGDGFDLLAAVPGCVAVTTGVGRGVVHVTVQQLDTPPGGAIDSEWETAEEVTFRALSGYTRAASGEFFPYAMMSPASFTESVTPSVPACTETGPCTASDEVDVRAPRGRGPAEACGGCTLLAWGGSVHRRRPLSALSLLVVWRGG